MDRKNIYLHVTNDDSTAYFPNNNASVFHVKLNKPLYLKGAWQLGVCELEIKCDLSSYLYVVCSACQVLVVDGKQTRVLRALSVNKTYHEIYPVIFYVPVETQFIDTIEFRLIQRNGTPISFKEQESFVHMTLHLTPC